MFEEELENAIIKLNEAKKLGLLSRFVLIGAFAVSFWGRPRATADFDFSIDSSKEKLPELASKGSGSASAGCACCSLGRCSRRR